MTLRFVEGKSSKKDAVKYWHIYEGTNRAGYVYVSKSKDELIGEHLSINIFINKNWQRKGIGTIAYIEVPKLVAAKKLYAHMAISNAGSFRAALKAGYKEIISEDFKQRVMVWKK
ncbi:MAG: hypothetical protein ABIO57_04055 [Candidatus Paceibacterota bacterium]